MVRKASIGALCALLMGCATTPQHNLSKLNPDDPVYPTAECAAAREEAARFNDHVGRRAATGLAAGLLGPIGIPIAAYSDVKAQQARRSATAALNGACHTDGVPLAPKQDDRNCSLDSTGEVMICAPRS